MKKALFKISFTLIVLFTFLACTSKNKSDATVSETGDSAPDFTLTDLDGNSRKLSDYKGKVVVLFFFGNTCPSCIGVAPSVESTFVTGYSGNSNVVILGIDSWDGMSSSVQSFKKTTKVTFPLLLRGSAVGDSYGVPYDRMVVVDKNGFVRFKGSNPVTNDLASAQKVVDEYLNK